MNSMTSNNNQYLNEIQWIEMRRPPLPPYFDVSQRQPHLMRGIPTTTTQQRPKKERKCGFCRCVGHNISNCGHPMRYSIIRTMKRDCDTLSYDRAQLNRYLSNRSLIELKVFAGRFGISVSMDKRTYVLLFTRIFYNDFIKQQLHPLHEIQINYEIINDDDVDVEEKETTEKKEEENICSICFDENIEKTDFIETDCSHKFCGCCVIQMINHNNNKNVLNCPMCRRNINSLTVKNDRHYIELKTILKKDF